MKQEHKELLTRDLGMRITTGVKYAKYSDHNSLIKHATLYSVSPMGVYEPGSISPWPFRKIKPCLFPLSMLTKEITINGETFVPYDKLFQLSDWADYLALIETNDYEMYTISRWPYELVQKLLEWHFDIHGLIELGLAVDATTVKCYE